MEPRKGGIPKHITVRPLTGYHNLYLLYAPPMFAAENPVCCKMRVAK